MVDVEAGRDEVYGYRVEGEHEVHDEDRRQVQQQLRQPNQGAVERDGSVCLPATLEQEKTARGFRWGYEGPRPSPVRHLAECGAKTCGTHRLLQPEVRPRFQRFCLRRFALTADAEGAFPATEALVYTSFGSGRLLFDFLFLEELRAEGRHIGCACLIDKFYGECHEERKMEPYEDCQKALEEFAAWFPETEVIAFSSGEEYTKACRDDSTLMCHILMHCDAADDSKRAETDSDSESDSEDSDLDIEDQMRRSAERAQARTARAQARAARLPPMPITLTEPEAKKDPLQRVWESLGSVPLGPPGIAPVKVLRSKGLYFSLSNNGNHEERKCSELMKPGTLTSTIECWQKVTANSEEQREKKTQIIADLQGDLVKMERIWEKGLNTETEAMRNKRLEVQQKKFLEAKKEGMVYKVVHSPFVVVRDSPSVTGKMLGGKRTGENVLVERMHENGLWVKLNPKFEKYAAVDGEGDEAWMLIDGASVGLGPLLELVS